MVTKSSRFGYDAEPEVNMPQNDKDDCDVESLITLLYMISDALHLCKERSVGGLESTQELCDILANAQSRTTAILAHLSETRSQPPNESIVESDGRERILVFSRK